MTGYQNCHHGTQADGTDHPEEQAGIGVIQEIAEHDRRDDTADVVADGNKAEYFTHFPGRRDRPNHHVPGGRHETVGERRDGEQNGDCL